MLTLPSAPVCFPQGGLAWPSPHWALSWVPEGHCPQPPIRCPRPRPMATCWKELTGEVGTFLPGAPGPGDEACAVRLARVRVARRARGDTRSRSPLPPFAPPDVDECAWDADLCQQGQRCVNLFGSYHCLPDCEGDRGVTWVGLSVLRWLPGFSGGGAVGHGDSRPSEEAEGTERPGRKLDLDSRGLRPGLA